MIYCVPPLSNKLLRKFKLGCRVYLSSESITRKPNPLQVRLNHEMIYYVPPSSSHFFTDFVRMIFGMYYTYVLQSQKNNSLYIGYTSDLQKRFQQHNSGESQSTRPFRPYVLIFYEAFLNQKDAKNREIYLKGGYGRRTLTAMLNHFLASPP